MKQKHQIIIVICAIILFLTLVSYASNRPAVQGQGAGATTSTKNTDPNSEPQHPHQLAVLPSPFFDIRFAAC